MDKLLVRQYAKDSILLFILLTRIPINIKPFWHKQMQ
jgi:hypothetical protein